MSGQGTPRRPPRSRGKTRSESTRSDRITRDTVVGGSAGTDGDGKSDLGGSGSGSGGPGGGILGRQSSASGKKSGFFFDVWLDRGLHSMFDEVASEPIPEMLLRLLDAGAVSSKPVDGAATPAPGSPDGSAPGGPMRDVDPDRNTQE